MSIIVGSKKCVPAARLGSQKCAPILGSKTCVSAPKPGSQKHYPIHLFSYFERVRIFEILVLDWVHIFWDPSIGSGTHLWDPSIGVGTNYTLFGAF